MEKIKINLSADECLTLSNAIDDKIYNLNYLIKDENRGKKKMNDMWLGQVDTLVGIKNKINDQYFKEMSEIITLDKLKGMYLELVLINFNLDDPFYYNNEDTKRDLSNVLTQFEEILNKDD